MVLEYQNCYRLIISYSFQWNIYMCLCCFISFSGHLSHQVLYIVIQIQVSQKCVISALLVHLSLHLYHTLCCFWWFIYYHSSIKNEVALMLLWSVWLFKEMAHRPMYPTQSGWSETPCRCFDSDFLKLFKSWTIIFLIPACSALNSFESFILLLYIL